MSANSSEPAEPEQARAERAAPAAPAAPALARFTRAELSRYCGADPALPNLIAYNGKVYDVTRSFPWAKGVHWGDHHAGQDLTGCMKESIHGEEMLLRVPCVGLFIE
jgi:predicted heme/steroid binding protein